jgi:hypothetical protein
MRNLSWTNRYLVIQRIPIQLEIFTPKQVTMAGKGSAQEERNIPPASQALYNTLQLAEGLQPPIYLAGSPRNLDWLTAPWAQRGLGGQGRYCRSNFASLKWQSCISDYRVNAVYNFQSYLFDPIVPAPASDVVRIYILDGGVNPHNVSSFWRSASWNAKSHLHVSFLSRNLPVVHPFTLGNAAWSYRSA